MNELDYQHKMQVIETEYLQAKRALYIEYANSQRLFKIGDIIKNDVGVIIEVQKYGVSVAYSLPKLRKDLEPKKNGGIGTIHGNNNVELLKQTTK
jgi:hypothetical protein